MIIKETITVPQEVVVEITCDKCGKRIEDDLEKQEMFIIGHDCGYNSIFGDGDYLQAEFCQECGKELFGAYLRRIE